MTWGGGPSCEVSKLRVRKGACSGSNPGQIDKNWRLLPLGYPSGLYKFDCLKMKKNLEASFKQLTQSPVRLFVCAYSQVIGQIILTLLIFYLRV